MEKGRDGARLTPTTPYPQDCSKHISRRKEKAGGAGRCPGVVSESVVSGEALSAEAPAVWPRVIHSSAPRPEWGVRAHFLEVAASVASGWRGWQTDPGNKGAKRRETQRGESWRGEKTEAGQRSGATRVQTEGKGASCQVEAGSAGGSARCHPGLGSDL